jgi:hypothetical protein
LQKRELHHVLQKYAGADQLLTGIGLGPDRGPMGLLPNADILSDNAVNIDSLISTAEAPFLPSVLPGTGVMPMEDLISDSVDILYYGPLSIGTPRQTMTVDVDTGSADLWVPVDCASCTNNQFDAEQSSTYKAMGDEFSISYVSYIRVINTVCSANRENSICRALVMLTERWRQMLFLLVA